MILLAACTPVLLVVVVSAWIGTRFAFGAGPGLQFPVEGGSSAWVRMLGALLEGPSGVLLLAAASLVAAATGLRVRPGRGPGAAEAARSRLGRAWRDLEGLTADAVGWVVDLPRRTGRWHVAALALVVAGGVAVRLLYLSQPVRYDEAFTFTHFASRPLELGLSRYTYPNNHLLHTLLVHLSTSAFGSPPAVLRLPAFLAGVAVVPATYVAWSALADADEALVAAAVAAVSSPLVLYSTNARGYTLVVACFLLLVPLAARLTRQRDLAAWSLFCLTAAAAFHAMPIALYPYGAVLVWMVLSGGTERADEAESGRPGEEVPGGSRACGSRSRRTLLREAAFATAAVAVVVGWLYMPAVQRSGVAAVVANRFVTPSPIPEFAAGLPGFFVDVWETWTRGWPGPVAAALGLLAVVGAGREARESLGAPPAGTRRSRVSFALVAIGWAVVVLLLNRRVPFARVWLFLVPVFGLLVGRGLGAAALLLPDAAAAAADGSRPGPPEGPAASGYRPRFRTAGPAAALLLVAGLGGSLWATDAVVESTATGPYRDGEDAARALQERMGRGDTVLALGPAEVVLEYWFQHLGLSPDRINAAPAGGGRLFLVVDRAQGQTLAELMARVGVSGSRRTRTREVVRLEHSTLYVLLPGG